MSEDARPSNAETAPGDEASESLDFGEGLVGYVIGLGLAALLTAGAFLLPTLNLVWAPSLPVALAVLAIAQMGVHLVFFLHITSGSDNVNNVMALAFGVLIVFLVLGGSIWIMGHMTHNMMLTDQPM